MRRFILFRHEDVSGVSGEGPVAEGIQWTDGTVALRWQGPYPSTAIWDNPDLLLGAHGHGGKTVVHWLDEDAP